MTSPVVIADTATRAELEEALTHLNRRAKREIAVMGTDKHPTPGTLGRTTQGDRPDAGPAG